MKTSHAIAAAALAALACWRLWPAADDAAQRGAAAGPAAAPQGAAGAGPSKPWPGSLPAAPAAGEVQRVPLLPVDGRQSAWLSMADARANGDARTPPLQRDAEPRSAPDAAQLADPQAYAAYQRGQHQQLLAAYAGAADAELPKLRADVERGRAAGVPAAELAKVEEKIRRIELQRKAALDGRR